MLFIGLVQILAGRRIHRIIEETIEEDLPVPSPPVEAPVPPDDSDDELEENADSDDDAEDIDDADGDADSEDDVDSEDEDSE